MSLTDGAVTLVSGQRPRVVVKGHISVLAGT